MQHAIAPAIIANGVLSQEYELTQKSADNEIFTYKKSPNSAAVVIHIGDNPSRMFAAKEILLYEFSRGQPQARSAFGDFVFYSYGGFSNSHVYVSSPEEKLYKPPQIGNMRILPGKVISVRKEELVIRKINRLSEKYNRVRLSPKVVNEVGKHGKVVPFPESLEKWAVDFIAEFSKPLSKIK